MVDIPTLNKSVNEFRATIKTNMQRSRDLQKEQLDKDNRLQQKIENVKGAIEENLKLNNKDAAKRQQQQLKTLEKALETRNEEKRNDAQRSETLRNILGVSTRRFNQQKQANEEAKLARERLDDLRKQLRSQGVDIKSNKNFQKLELEVEKKERKARLKSKPLLSSLEEQRKDAFAATGKQFAKYFGPSSFFGKSFGKLNQKLISPFLGGLGAALKGGAFVLGLLALIEFLNSDLWKNLRNTLIPDIKEKLDGGLKSLKRIFESFFGEEGGFSKGFEQTTEELFGEDSNISKVLNVVFLPLLTNIGDGFKAIADILDPPEGKKPLDLLLENAGTLLSAILSLAVFIAPGLLLKGFWNIGVKAFGGWLVIPTLKKSLSFLLNRLLGLSKQLDDLAKGVPVAKPGLLSRAGSAVAGVFKGVASTFTGGTAVSKLSKIKSLDLTKGAPVGANVTKVGTVAKTGVPSATSKLTQLGTDAKTGASTTSKLFNSDGSANAAAIKNTSFLMKIPGMGIFLKSLPFIAPIINTGLIFNELLQYGLGNQDGKTTSVNIGGLFGGIAGSVAGSVLGLSIGTLSGGLPGAAIGTVMGSLLGTFSGDAVGRALAELLIYGKAAKVQSFPEFTGMNDIINNAIATGGRSLNPLAKIVDAQTRNLMTGGFTARELGNTLEQRIAQASALSKNMNIPFEQAFSNLVSPMALSTARPLSGEQIEAAGGDSDLAMAIQQGLAIKNPDGTFTRFTPDELIAKALSIVGGGNSNNVNVSPVSIDQSSVQNVSNVIRQMTRGDIFTSNALQNLGAVAL